MIFFLLDCKEEKIMIIDNKSSIINHLSYWSVHHAPCTHTASGTGGGSGQPVLVGSGDGGKVTGGAVDRSGPGTFVLGGTVGGGDCVIAG